MSFQFKLILKLCKFSHFENTSHTFTKSLGQDLVWDYAGDNFVHRLIQSSIDGKMVELLGDGVGLCEILKNYISKF